MQENDSIIEKIFDKNTHQFKEQFEFKLMEDAKLGYLVHFAAPFTGDDECVVPKGTIFTVTQPMRDDAFYIHRSEEEEMDEEDELNKVMIEKVKTGRYKEVVDRLQGFSFFITEEQLKTIPLEFLKGSQIHLRAIIAHMKYRWTGWKNHLFEK